MIYHKNNSATFVSPFDLRGYPSDSLLYTPGCACLFNSQVQVAGIVTRHDLRSKRVYSVDFIKFLSKDVSLIVEDWGSQSRWIDAVALFLQANDYRYFVMQDKSCKMQP